VKGAFLLALMMLSLAGCVSAKVFPSGTGNVYAPTDKDAVLVYFSREDVQWPYEVIAEILAEGSSGWGHNDSALVSKARKKAAKLGAHAIIVTKEKGARAVTAMVLGAQDRVQRVQAIRFIDPRAKKE
jgi:creatinine amidohydrolase/Fe(II)-dependent formamide hydrolase-like protein